MHQLTRTRVASRIVIAITTLLASACATGTTTPAQPETRAVLTKEFIYTQAPFPEAHASTVVELPDGRIAAAFFGGTKERNADVSIWYAVKRDEEWSVPREVATGEQPDGTLMPTWNPVLFQPPGGALHLFYKEGPNPREWWGMVTTSTDGGETWSTPERLPDGILGPIKNKPVILADGTWLSPSSVEGSTYEGWTLHVERSEDDGATWTASDPVESPEGIDAIQPSILFHPDGRLQMLARTRQGNVAMSWSEDDGETWSPVAATVLPNPNSGTDAVTLEDGRQLIVYNPTAHNAETPGKGYRYPLNVAVSSDGLSWDDVLVLETEPLPSGYAYPAVIQSSDGHVHITYTHNRERITYVELDPEKLD